MTPQPSDDAKLALLEMEADMLQQMLAEYKNDPKGQHPWKVAPASSLMRVWREQAQLGFVRNEKALDRLKIRFVENYVRLCVNTALSGHEEANFDEELAHSFETEADREAFVEWAIQYDGGWRISDTAPKLMFSHVAALMESKDSEAALLCMDAILNIVHQRSDLASWFVEGGARTLNELSEVHIGQQPAP